jgi:hypothetical protein
MFNITDVLMRYMSFTISTLATGFKPDLSLDCRMPVTATEYIWNLGLRANMSHYFGRPLPTVVE